jgi:hypothetical protein
MTKSPTKMNKAVTEKLSDKQKALIKKAGPDAKVRPLIKLAKLDQKTNESFTLASDVKNSKVMKFLNREGAAKVEEYTIDVDTGIGEAMHHELYSLKRLGLINFKQTGEDGYNLTFKMKLTPKATTNEATQADLDENKPIIATGVKGMKSTSFRKKFRNMAAYDKWTDSDAYDDFDVQYVFNESAKPSKKINEGVLDDMDDDGFMAKRQLYDLAKYSVELHRMIQDTDNLEPWVQAKITKAADYISTVKHYLEYQGVRDGSDMADEIGFDDMAGVDSSLDTMAPDMPTEEVMEFEEEEEDVRIDGYDVLRYAKLRNIISQEQCDNPSPEVEEIAHWIADSHFELGYEVGSSDITNAMKQFCQDMVQAGQICDGKDAYLYESANTARAIYNKMISGLRGK